MAVLHYPEHLPALLIGVIGSYEAQADVLPWAHVVHHQHGGYACSQTQLYGVLLPLAVVPACVSLLAGFDALSLDAPSKAAFTDFPDLAAVHLTAGQDYDLAAIQALQRFLARADFEFPLITGGTEALLEFGSARPAHFLGWPLLMLEMPETCSLIDPQAHDLVMGPLATYPGRTLSGSSRSSERCCRSCSQGLSPLEQ